MWGMRPAPHADGMTYLIYVPVAVIFVAFVIGGGLILPLWGILDAARD